MIRAYLLDDNKKHGLGDLSKRLVPETDRSAFAEILEQAFLKLHEGSVARYRLRRCDFLDWVRIRDGGTG